jgi:hypothetical protein
MPDMLPANAYTFYKKEEQIFLQPQHPG